MQAVVGELLKRLEEGTEPNPYVVKGLGDLAVAFPVAFAPHVKAMLNRVVPALPHLRADTVRLIYAYGLGQVAESIMLARSNKGDPKLGEESHKELVAAYQVLAQQWLKLQSTVGGAAAEACSQVLVVLLPKTFEVEVAQLMPSLLGLYKKSRDPLPITSAVSLLLEHMHKLGIGAAYLEANTNQLLLALFPMLCATSAANGNFEDPNLMKNHNKTLRCFETLTVLRPEFPISFALQKLSVRSSVERLGSLTLLRHLVQHADKELHKHVHQLVAKVVSMMKEADLNLRKAVAQTMISMASMAYLDPASTASLLDFCVKYAATTDQQVDEFARSQRSLEEAELLGELRTMCERILDLISRSVPTMEEATWPFLLEILLKPDAAPASAVVCKSLVNIVHRRQQDQLDPLLIQFGQVVSNYSTYVHIW